jgi:hypothetical protein
MDPASLVVIPHRWSYGRQSPGRGVDRVHGHVATHATTAAVIHCIGEPSGGVHSDCQRIHGSWRYGEGQGSSSFPRRVQD